MFLLPTFQPSLFPVVRKIDRCWPGTVPKFAKEKKKKKKWQQQRITRDARARVFRVNLLTLCQVQGWPQVSFLSPFGHPNSIPAVLKVNPTQSQSHAPHVCFLKFEPKKCFLTPSTFFIIQCCFSNTLVVSQSLEKKKKKEHAVMTLPVHSLDDYWEQCVIHMCSFSFSPAHDCVCVNVPRVCVCHDKKGRGGEKPSFFLSSGQT